MMMFAMKGKLPIGKQLKQFIYLKLGWRHGKLSSRKGIHSEVFETKWNQSRGFFFLRID